jgi:hypothetical protein
MFIKTGIFVALTALLVAVFAIPEAQGINGQTLNLRIWGANLISSDEDGIPTPIDGRAITAFQSGVARGHGGSASVFASIALPALDPGQIPPDCAGLGLAGGPIFQTIVLTYNDEGSLLSLVAGPGSFYCTDGEIFTIESGGDIAAGNGRFEGATGTWELTAQTLPPGGTGLFTGEISIDLN